MTTTGTSTAAVWSALVVGAIAGALAVWFVTHPAEGRTSLSDEAPGDAPDAAVRDYTPEELSIVCLPYMRRTATALEGAQTRVSALELRIRDKEDEIQRLERQMVATSGAKVEVSARLEAARTQLGDMRADLARALDDKAALLVDLARVQEDLNAARIELAQSQAKTLELREESLQRQWQGFVQNAQLTICRAGNASRVETCRLSVQGAMLDLKERYKSCIRGGAAVPEVRAASKVEEVPEGYGVWIDRTNPELEDWYVLFCDPELPEADRPANRREDGRGSLPFD